MFPKDQIYLYDQRCSNQRLLSVPFSVFAGCQIPYPKREFLNEDEPEEKTEKVIIQVLYYFCMYKVHCYLTNILTTCFDFFLKTMV